MQQRYETGMKEQLLFHQNDHEAVKQDVG
jgi:hypothetical protein